MWKAFRWALTCKTTLVKHWSQSSCQQQRYCFDVGTDGSCRSDSVTEWIYVEALIGKLHLAFLEQWPEMLEQTTTNCWPKPVVEGVVEDDWNFGNERRKTWACCWVFKEKVDSWDAPERKTTVQNKTHKLNTFPLLRKEHHRHFSFSLDMWFTTLSGSEWLSQTRAFWGDNHGVLFCFRWLYYSSFETEPSLFFYFFMPSWFLSQMLGKRAHLLSRGCQANPFL